jgi:hypothetical protein
MFAWAVETAFDTGIASADRLTTVAKKIFLISPPLDDTNYARLHDMIS